jgi:uncharacterized short protein YbdD (DUF466 family)
LWACEVSMLIRLRGFVSRVSHVGRQLVGAPDYERYLAHVRERHPGTEPLAYGEFYRARLEERYSRPGAKCC